jgi:HK97 family phage major capsid protein
MNLKSLYDKKAAIYADMKDLQQRLKSENRGMNADEQERFEKSNADFEEIEKQIENLERLEKITSAREENEAQRQEQRSEEPKYLDVFLKHFRKQNLSNEERAILNRGTNTITTTTSGTTYGGYNVPIELMNEIDIALLAFGGMMNVSRIVTTAGGGTLNWPTLDDTSAKAVIVAEAGSTTVQDMTFGRVQFGAYTYRDLVKLSLEFLQDEATNVVGELGSLLGIRFARALNEHFTTGDGSSKPTGFVGSAGTVTGASASAITADDIFDLLHGVDPAYRGMPSAAFMMNDSTLKAIKKLTIGTSDDRPLWVPSLRDGEPSTLLGKPYVINQDMADIGASAKPIAFGDWSKYIIRRVREVNIRRLDERFADDLSVGFLAFARYDGKLINTSAIKVLAQPAS